MSSSPQPPLAVSPLAAGYRFNEFEILEVIGGGGFGIVYRARDHQLERTIAIKEYVPASLASRNPDGSLHPRSERQLRLYQAGLNSFIQEARLLARFNHPGLLNVLRFWEQNGTAYMVTLCYSGVSLKRWQQQSSQPVNESWLQVLLPPLFSAISTLHQAGYLHRDISLDNIQLQDNGQPVLLDFGSARKEIGNLADETEIMLKPGYAPIEQYSEEGESEQGPWTDIYALGAVLHTLITGNPPPVSMVRCIEDNYLPLAVRRPPGYSLALLDAVDQALAMDPAARPQSVEQLAALVARSEPEVVARRAQAAAPSSTPGPVITVVPQADVATSPAVTDVMHSAAAAEAAATASVSAAESVAPAIPSPVAMNHAAAAAQPVMVRSLPRRLSQALLSLSLLSVLVVAVVVWQVNRSATPRSAGHPPAPVITATVYLKLQNGESLLLNGKPQAVKADSNGFAVLQLTAGSWQIGVKNASGIRSQTLTVERAGSWLVNPQP